MKDDSIPLNFGPQPISTFVYENKKRFIGLILETDHDDNPFWEMIELLQIHGDRIFNLNSNNYTNIFPKLTHWMEEPHAIAVPAALITDEHHHGLMQNSNTCNLRKERTPMSNCHTDVWVPIPYTAGDPQPRISDGIYRGIRSDGNNGFEGLLYNSQSTVFLTGEVLFWETDNETIVVICDGQTGTNGVLVSPIDDPKDGFWAKHSDLHRTLPKHAAPLRQYIRRKENG